MKVKAKVSFSGIISMGKGQVKDIADEAIIKDLLKAGYVEEVKDPAKEEQEPKTKAKKAVKPGEDKQDNG